MVSEVSAIAVDSTSLRCRPSRAAGGALRGEAAWRRKADAGVQSRAGGRPARRRCARISPSPGRKARTPPSVSSRAAGERAAASSNRAPFRAGGRSRQRVSTGKARPSEVITGARPEARRPARRRAWPTSPAAQVLAQGAAHLPGEGEAEIGVEGAFVELVEDHRADAGQFRVGCTGGSGCPRSPPRCASPGGCGCRRACGSRRCGPPARPASGHALGGGAGGEAARLQHHDAARHGARVQQGQRHPRRLAGTRRGLQHGTAGQQRRDEIGQRSESMGSAGGSGGSESADGRSRP